MKAQPLRGAQTKRWGLSWEFQAVAQALYASLHPQAESAAGLPEQLHRARVQLMRGLSDEAADSSRVLREMAAGALRRWGLVRALQALMSARKTLVEPLPEAITLGDCLIRLSLSWMIEQPQKAAMVVDQAVECAKRITPKSASYTNALLRRFAREREALIQTAQQQQEATWNVPAWWLAAMQEAYPHAWQRALEAANKPAPLSLRVNRRKITPQALRALMAEQGFEAAAFENPPESILNPEASPLLHTADALYLPASTDPKRLAGFAQGFFSVQDLGAQQAAWLLDLHDGMRVLDACAAPGGKSGHILELADCDLEAWDGSARRLERVAENLKRLQLAAKLACVDILGAAKLPAPPESFDRILLDAPCSASGIIGRHPEIRWRRQPQELALHQAQQRAMLGRLWPLLKPGGALLFVTCSLFPQEGRDLIADFVEQCREAEQLPLAGFSALLPSNHESLRHDGFYYATLRKRRN
ncbi:MAG: 16S rRNA (cytosine(967)-C(5))-methyltransferase RsmB [Betaproteobacteria bacterium]|nr:16S rRNA (cytosine(967)-C(5))-methyltransferase RsmB [Betaproteobacteria bacterium]